MRVRAGIITGLHLQSFDLFGHGSELYSSIGTFQSSVSARTSDLPTNIPNSCTNVCSASTTPAVGPRRPLLDFSFAHSITSECGGMHTVSVVSAKHSVAAWKRWSWMVSYPPPDNVPSTKSRMNGSCVASPKISIPSMAWQFRSTTTVSMWITSPCTDSSKLHIPCTVICDLFAASSSICILFRGVCMAPVSTSFS